MQPPWLCEQRLVHDAAINNFMMMQVRAGMKKALKELGSGGRAENAEQPAAASATTSPSTADVTEL